MPTSTLTSKGQTTVPKEVREALRLETGTQLSWEIRGGTVVVTTTERPALWRWEGYIKHGPDAVTAVKMSRKLRGRPELETRRRR